MSNVSPLAGKTPPLESLVNVPLLVTRYFSDIPDPSVPEQRVSFGTSGHRGSSLRCSFNERHILAIAQAICNYRRKEGIDGPLFLGIDTHALSEPAFATTMEVLAANGVGVMIAGAERYTPTPAVSHAVLCWNRERRTGLADGIVVTPSHNPPEDGGFKYNPSHGGPAGSAVTSWIENEANAILEGSLNGVRRITLERAMKARTTRRYDYLDTYTADLASVLDMDAIRAEGLSLGADPLGGAGVDYWERIAERYGLDLEVVQKTVDPTFRFMSVDRDGKIRMDPSSSFTMQPLLSRRDRFDIAFACDTDHDRHGIVTRGSGLLQPNHYLAVCIDYLFRRRAGWPVNAMVGKTVVSSSMIDRVARRLGRGVREVPVGFKWFVDGLLDSSLGFAGEESAGASFLRKDGSVWTTDKDGFIPALLSAEITAREGRDPGEVYRELTRELGEPTYRRIDAPATPAEKARLKRLDLHGISLEELADERIEHILTSAPGNGESIGGLKVVTENGWFAARPSGTEDVYKIYAESFLGEEHVGRILDEARMVVRKALDGE
ncbi:phosphoglucomutase, alpha-D-glucose phosphate-specific [Prosthecochloris sp. GSB1]|uniref:phosphoglucomutase (alpha-D-glucose-1,6-bisphosphate-dependent) n=1 Tax=Prosthecochloris sp. GSB1 TaxID=281093 RepID=UPI000B8D06DB|nr:phosphoglucomutase (alpha-D-glucose-1,6-bisphosphate-dependent) [Prosthecochloris sp. GSB1]ASQ91680.1 phosphoglucomutase, alpha-D-glucose phosphate-specific [Prosthecochloris sp. GSB1]